MPTEMLWIQEIGQGGNLNPKMQRIHIQMFCGSINDPEWIATCVTAHCRSSGLNHLGIHQTQAMQCAQQGRFHMVARVALVMRGQDQHGLLPLRTMII